MSPRKAAEPPAPPPVDTHKHRCGYAPRGEEPAKGCGHVWQHERPPRDASSEEYAKAHQCPCCGIENRWRYHGRVPVGQKRLKQKEAT